MNQTKKRSHSLFTEFVKKEIGGLLLITAVLIGFAGVRTYSASYIAKIVVMIQNRDSIARLMGTAFVGFLVISSSYGMRYTGSVLSIRLNEKLALQTRCRLMEHLQHIPWVRYEKLETGQLQSVLRNDVQQGADIIYTLFSRIQLNVLLFLATFLYMLLISPVPAIFVAAVTLLMAFVNQRILMKQKRYQKLSRDAAGDISETILCACRSMGTVKAYGAGGFILASQDKKRFNDSTYKAEQIDGGRLTLYNLTNNLTLYASILYLATMGLRERQI